MKKSILFSLIVLSIGNLFAQSKKKSASQAAAAPAPCKLNNQTDSLSYSIGIMVASFY